MKRFYILILLPILFSSATWAQNVVNETVIGQDSTAVVHKISFAEIMDLLTTSGYGEGKITVDHSPRLVNAMEMQLERNEKKSISGYRISIFSDNRQNSREISQNIINDFALSYPNIKSYRKYTAPYFRVRVGDFRTLSEAMKFLGSIKSKYPAAFLVKENINPVD